MALGELLEGHKAISYRLIHDGFGLDLYVCPLFLSRIVNHHEEGYAYFTPGQAREPLLFLGPKLG